MLHVSDLSRPVIVAPMAGGPSTPGLVTTAAEAGGMGFLAAGYRSVEEVVEQVEMVQRAGTTVFGVNLFVPGTRPTSPSDLAAVRTYRDRLVPLARHYGVEMPRLDPDDDRAGTSGADDDGWHGKIPALLDLRVPMVSFTFGCPPADVVSRFHQVGTACLATVTSAGEARRATAAGVDALVVQGPGAGGHRAVFDARANPPEQSLDDLFGAVRSVVDLPLVVTGGLTAPEEVRPWLGRADAVALGTAFLDAEEAGTHPLYRAALHDSRFTQTVVTRAFSGRWARGLRNGFTDAYSDRAPAAYPAVNRLTGVLRAAAARSGDLDNLSLWAGTSWQHTPTGTVAQIMRGLTDGLVA
ncbi:NAD(P)H-dependent flavin oxidoreductase [Actinomyces lilanjuaniae]|nr:nitronate monooxygenase [Actinomyces lilanjuaniae]